MKNKIINYLILGFSFLMVLPYSAVAQCPMCKQSLASARADGGTTVGNTLNNGIMYLLAFPYVLAVVFLFLYFKNQKTKKKIFLNKQ